MSFCLKFIVCFCNIFFTSLFNILIRLSYLNFFLVRIVLNVRFLHIFEEYKIKPNKSNALFHAYFRKDTNQANINVEK